jgi:hypothetical protein
MAAAGKEKPWYLQFIGGRTDDASDEGHLTAKVQDDIAREYMRMTGWVQRIKDGLKYHHVLQGDSRFICPLLWRVLRRVGIHSIPRKWEHYGSNVRKPHPIDYTNPVWEQVVEDIVQNYPDFVDFLQDVLQVPRAERVVGAVIAVEARKRVARPSKEQQEQLQEQLRRMFDILQQSGGIAGAASAAPAPKANWVCSKCTYAHNDPARTVCEVCDVKKQGKKSRRTRTRKTRTRKTRTRKTRTRRTRTRN